MPICSPSAVSSTSWIGLEWSVVLARLRYSTNAAIPPLKQNSCSPPLRSSLKRITSPGLRNASSRSLCTSRSWWNSRIEKISGSGLNVTTVPFFAEFPTLLRGATGTPCRYSCSKTPPSRRISSRSHSDKKFTTETPTPCRPPETL